MLDLSVYTLRQYIREGDLAAFRLPGNRSRWRIWPSDIRAFAEAGKVRKVA
jgi:predicted site-specific integrase-resolvase